MKDDEELDPLIWLWLPIGFALLQIAARLFDAGDGFYFTYFETEQGLVEIATALVLLPAALFGVRVGIREGFSITGWWYLCVAAVCLGYFGEEVSWGQHWLGFESPEFFATHNRQGETNLHNLNIHLGRVAKSILTALIIVGALIVPPLRRRRGLDVDYRYWPSNVCVPTALLVFAVRLVERVKTWFDLDALPLMDMNLKELQEFYLALFLLMYTWSVARRRAGA